ncbi:MAG: hypothetical protein LBV47_07315 [Bacteroidales bacterium]|jgi:hypothetical protein|nr:hypothetical protein [Bacteroidales bacterium]
MTISKDSVFMDYSNNISAIIIEEGVTLTIQSWNFHVRCKFVNLGEVVVGNNGGINFAVEPAQAGIINTTGNAYVNLIADIMGADEIAAILDGDSIYNMLSLFDQSVRDGAAEIVIDKDIVIPAGKTLRIYQGSVLKINSGVTLTNNGTILYFIEPIVDGEIIGTGTMTKWR